MTPQQTLEDMPKSSLHDLVYAIFNSVYSPELSPYSDVKEDATQDVLRLFSLHSQDLKRKIEDMPTQTISFLNVDEAYISKLDLLALIEGK